MPDFRLERDLGGRVAGIDEVGRGPLAGPVVAAAVILPPRLPAGLRRRIRDSKRMSAAERLAVARLLRAVPGIAIARAAANVAEIDRLNIRRASHLAMQRALTRLVRDHGAPDGVLVDGNDWPDLAVPGRTIIGGDDRSLSIAAASIVAKVCRDRLMVRLARTCPGYGWERNMGYGTAAHLAALRALGPTPHHRTSFRPVGVLGQGRAGAGPAWG
ncbi:MAG: ribonuclease HII [Alphaproteobacteria bacterium]